MPITSKILANQCCHFSCVYKKNIFLFFPSTFSYTYRTAASCCNPPLRIYTTPSSHISLFLYLLLSTTLAFLACFKKKRKKMKTKKEVPEMFLFSPLFSLSSFSFLLSRNYLCPYISLSPPVKHWCFSLISVYHLVFFSLQLLTFFFIPVFF